MRDTYFRDAFLAIIATKMLLPSEHIFYYIVVGFIFGVISSYANREET